MRLEDMHPRDVAVKHGPLVADLVTRHRELLGRHDQLCACVDDLLNVDAPGPDAVALVELADQLLTISVPK